MHLSPIEFHYALEDKGQVFDFEYNRLKITCETIRTSAFQIINANRDRRSRVKSPKYLMEFPWDNGSVDQSVEQMKKMAKVLAQMFAGNKVKENRNGSRVRKR